MRNVYGEFYKLDCDSLARKLGISNLETAFRATSMVDVKKYNCDKEKCGSSATRVGISLNEGMVRRMFLKEYEKIRYKQAGSPHQSGAAPVPYPHRSRFTEPDAVIKLKRTGIMGIA